MTAGERQQRERGGDRGAASRTASASQQPRSQRERRRSDGAGPSAAGDSGQQARRATGSRATATTRTTTAAAAAGAGAATATATATAARARRRAPSDGDGNQPEISEDDVLVPVAGILDILDNYAFVRTSGYLPGPNDVYVSLAQVRKYGLRKGDAVTGAVRQPREGERKEKFNALVRLDTVNGADAGRGPRAASSSAS